jgi:hypothetical protein
VVYLMEPLNLLEIAIAAGNRFAFRFLQNSRIVKSRQIFDLHNGGDWPHGRVTESVPDRLKNAIVDAT